MAHAKLRPLAMSDLDNLMTWVNDPDVVGNFANFKLPISREKEQQYLETILASETDKAFAIENENGEYLGHIGLHQIHWPTRSSRLAAIVAKKDQRNKGYGQSAINEILRLAFEEYNLHKVWLVVFEENELARHVYRKCGFVEEGILRDEYYHRGRYHHMVRMSILAQDFLKMRTES